MQINTTGFPAGLLGAGSVDPAAGTGIGTGFGLLLGAPTNVSCAGMTPPAAANDPMSPLKPAPVTMAQLLTTAAPLASAPPMGTQPVAVAPGAQPAAAAPADSLPVDAQLPVTPSASPAGDLPAEAPLADAEMPQAPGKPAQPGPNVKPGKPAANTAPVQPEAPALPAPAEAAVEAEPTEPADAPKTPVKRGPRSANAGNVQPEAALATTPDAAPVAADMSAMAAAQAPARPELATKPQPGPARSSGEVSPGGRKGDAVRAVSTAAADTGPTAGTDKNPTSAAAAVAGKSGQANDSAAGDERGQAPAFTLRHDAHAAPGAATAHVSDPARVQAAPAVAAAEPVIAARPGHLGQTMGVEIARSVEAGDDTLRVRLSPDNLGKVEVTLSFDDSGTLRATVRAESAHALDLLRQDAPDLGRALDQAGIRSDTQSFRFESRGEGSNAQAQHQQQHQNASGGQLAGNDETETTDIAYRGIRGDGQVDLLA
jgi:flagellar hook-length control protein FliK